MNQNKRERERGAALLVIMVGMSLILLVLLSGLTMASYSGKSMKRQLTYQGQAMNAARAGLTEGLSWFIRQELQPVVNFDPLLDVNGICTHTPAHNPPINDTEDPSLGIVRSYVMTTVGGVQGRYELKKLAVKDLTVERGKSLVDDGTVWEMESEGIVYVENDSSVAYDQAPNVVLARRRMKSEIQRLQLRLPTAAAIFATRGAEVVINTGARVRGSASATGIAYPISTGTPTYSTVPSATVEGTPAVGALSGAVWSVQGVFGMTAQELVQSADMVVPDAASIIAHPAMGLVVIQGDATFAETNPLNGSGILVIFGNLVIEKNTLSRFSGVIYVEGTVAIQEPTAISGSIIAATPQTTTGPYVTLSGEGDLVEINYDVAIITQIRQQLGQYRTIRPPYVPGS